MRRFRHVYGAHPLHLLAATASFGLIAESLIGWLARGSDARGILSWFLGGLAVSQVLLITLSWLVDRRSWGRGSSAQASPARPQLANYIRVPVLLSALLLLVFLPLIAHLGAGTFSAATGSDPGDFVIRWLCVTGGLFACSGVLYAFRRALGRRTQR